MKKYTTEWSQKEKKIQIETIQVIKNFFTLLIFHDFEKSLFSFNWKPTNLSYQLNFQSETLHSESE